MASGVVEAKSIYPVLLDSAEIADIVAKLSIKSLAVADELYRIVCSIGANQLSAAISNLIKQEISSDNRAFWSGYTHACLDILSELDRILRR